MPVTRRDALRLGSGGALALVIGGAAGWVDRRDGTDAAPAGSAATPPTSSTTATTTTTAAPVVVPEIGEIDPAIVTLGRRVIEHTGQSDLAGLLTLLPEADGDPLIAASERIRTDFRTGDTIVVDGWVLAASEARAAAVIALLCDDTC